MPEMGEYIVGSYLRLILGCELVIYNQKLSRKKGEFSEVDVLGIDVDKNTVYICEVVTHIGGMLYRNYTETMKRIKRKFQDNIKYADNIFPSHNKIYMLWSPYVNKGKLTNYFEKLHNELRISENIFKLVINKKYTKKVNELRVKAKKDMKDSGEPFFRALQILEHLR
jgi:hypothetical protein